MDVKKQSIRGLIASDLPKSEVISTLSKRVIESEIHNPKYNYLFTKLFGKQMVFDGLKDVNYVEYQTTSSNNPYADTVIDDFNGSTNKVIRDTVEATKQSNVKTKILDSKLLNFRTNPADAVAVAFTNTENISKAQELYWEKEMWDNLKDNGVVEDTTGLEDVTTTGDNVNKLIYKTLLDLGTTSKSHKYVGVDGVITCGTDTIQPAKKFDTSEFILIKSNDLTTNTVFDGERSFFKWEKSQLELAGVETLDFTKYEALSDLDFDATRAILIHKEAFLNIMDWEGSKLTNGPKLYQVLHNYLKTETYHRKDKPMIIFEDVPVKKTDKPVK